MLDLVSVIGAVGLFSLIAALRSPLPTEPDEPVVTFGVVTVDLAAHTVSKAESGIVKLTPTEWHFLEVLMRNPERLVTRHFVLTTVWGLVYQTGGGNCDPSSASSVRNSSPSHPNGGSCRLSRGSVTVSRLGMAGGAAGASRPARRPRLGSPRLASPRLAISCYVCRSSQDSDVPKSEVPACRRPGLPTSRNAAVAITPRGGSRNSRRDAHLPPRPVLSPATGRPPPGGGNKRSRYLWADG